jgi:serine/threonine protein kinase
MKWSGFGLSKKVNERGSHSISEVKGTDNWFSPEILTIMRKGNDGKTTSPDIRPRGTVKSDVFSAGLVFGYYLLGLLVQVQKKTLKKTLSTVSQLI